MTASSKDVPVGLPLWLMAVAAPLLWGTTYAVTQAFLAGVDPFWLATLRIVVPGVMMVWLVPLAVWRRHWLNIVVLSALNIGIFTVLLFGAIQRLPGGMAATLTASMPLQLLLLRALQGRLPAPLQLLAAVGGMAGVGLLVWQAPAEPDWTGVALALAAAFCMALGVLLMPVLGRGIKPLVLASAQLFSAGVVLLLLMLLWGRPFPALDTQGVLALVWLGPVGMGLGYYLWFRAITLIAVDKLAFMGLINPVVAVLAGVLVMGELMNISQAFAIALVLFCVLLAQHPAAQRHLSAARVS
ncbi:DMT family transporter [Thalassolituus alkanivorans]|uniref:DMT family transporter n=1 Tax=Thalassolituus alkanivorans TaxID=2881055 RepID=UPI001E3F3311|nr:EamA family transporter [Thalassolituus alkanivorans]MCB2385550.1 EamA family transporter [Thalassolituus alkanivorans]MCB2423194.1 EamA family transporter [Thalassolituus alkanivorans]